MSKEEEVVQAHPEGEVQIARNQPAETATSLDTFAGKVHVKWAPEAAVSSLGLMPFFIEFLKTSGLFDKWVEDCPLHYTSGNAGDLADGAGADRRAALPGPGRCGEQLRRAEEPVGVGRLHDTRQEALPDHGADDRLGVQLVDDFHALGNPG